MKITLLFLTLSVSILTFSQVTSSTELPGEYELFKAQDFKYDGSSGFVFFENMIYEEAYGNTEWWKNMKGIWKGSYLSADKRSKKYNLNIKESLSSDFNFPYQLIEKFEVIGTSPKLKDGVLESDRYIIDYVISTTPVHGNQGGNTYTNYYIYDMQESKKYFVLATLSVGKLINKLNKVIEGK